MKVHYTITFIDSLTRAGNDHSHTYIHPCVVETPKNVKEVTSGTPVSFIFIQGSDERSGETASKVFDKLAYQNQGIIHSSPKQAPFVHTFCWNGP
jgi:hypothetical protein